MTQISIAARTGAVRDPFASNSTKPSLMRPNQRPMMGRPLIGKPLPATGGSIRDAYLREEIEEDDEQDMTEASAQPSIPGMRTAQPETFEKVVKRIPTLYVIAFFGVVVMCAVSIIWNTLQVNRLTLEKTRANDRIAQTEQRLIKLRAQEMQLSAPSRIRALAKEKLGMIEETGSEVVFVKQQ
jgi:cell division protein FtsL